VVSSVGVGADSVFGGRPRFFAGVFDGFCEPTRRLLLAILSGIFLLVGMRK
jgi:hypothetical protein